MENFNIMKTLATVGFLVGVIGVPFALPWYIMALVTIIEAVYYLSIFVLLEGGLPIPFGEINPFQACSDLLSSG